jgi:DNA modification methylase
MSQRGLQHAAVEDSMELRPSEQNASTDDAIGLFALDSVQHLDCLEGMRALPDNSVDLAIADPPYNASKGNLWKWDNSVKMPGFGGDWSKVDAHWDDMPLADYMRFTLQWLSEVKRVVRPTGSLWVHGTYHNIGIVNMAMQLLDIEIINEVVWYKRNSFPNLSTYSKPRDHSVGTQGCQERVYVQLRGIQEYGLRRRCPEDSGEANADCLGYPKQ